MNDAPPVIKLKDQKKQVISLKTGNQVLYLWQHETISVQNMFITFEPIGTIHTPFKTREGMPIQSKGAKGIMGTIAIKEEFRAGLADIEGFSHIILIYHFHQSSGFELKVTPFLDNTKRGVFATRAPKRPNPIGLSVVRLLKIEDNIIHFEHADMLDGTPLLDIKPYVPDFDIYPAEKTGWYPGDSADLNNIRSDERFKK